MQTTGTPEFRSAVDKITEYTRNFTGIQPVFNENTGLNFPIAVTNIKFNNVTIGIYVMQLPGKTVPDVLLSSILCHFPKENLVAFFRQLLNWNFLDTDVTHFSINDKANTVQLNMKRPIQDFDYSEFVNAAQTLSALTMNYIPILVKQWGITS